MPHPAGNPVDQPGAPGMPGGNPPPFSLRPRAAASRRLPPAHACGRSLFAAPKRKRRWSRQKKKRQSPGSQALRALPPGGTRVVTVLLSYHSPYITTGGVPIRPPHPPAPCCTPPSSGKDRIDQLLFPRSPLRSALPGWSRPVAETTAPPLPCGELNPAGKGTDSHVASLLGMTENPCHCEEAAGRRGNPPPPSLP